ncbi:uncharacterized protein JG29_07830 [Bombilactobacillus mellis]|uniref:Uncharacterized protein n=1 Tax=Bombilactobacillus mellis TaxID=1218508 RepID=A0A0F4KQP0_9LACO|nr:DUF6275 family protein [Bombilactobacillus mellis]MCT6891039.1 DUF6275 family protein [Lactobacillus sp.]KJY48962.1 uncharacterized protein JG29_07830 [Bombilactobacillus mellis]MCT6856749.1 DUF6275 family protein [Bombilactobacillus mellis]MCX0279493.1 DUF6275 family protein [Bombilactobacillus mellis]NUG67577.1 hypothetical protein [Bombilactobacillus mellis]
MNNINFLRICRQLLVERYNKMSDFKQTIGEEDIQVIWSCQTLQNNKAILSTNYKDGIYYEISYDGNKKEFNLDVYHKIDNSIYSDVAEY